MRGECRVIRRAFGETSSFQPEVMLLKVCPLSVVHPASGRQLRTVGVTVPEANVPVAVP